MSTLNNTLPIIVNLTGFFHKGQHCLGIYYNNYGSLNGALRKAGAVWTATHKCWWVPLNKASYEAVIIACESCAIVTRQLLDEYLRSLATDTLKSPSPQQPEMQNQEPGLVKVATKALHGSKYYKDSLPSTAIHPINVHVLPAMQQMLVLKGYSPSTHRTYLGEMSVYLRTLGANAADDMSVQRLKDYLAYCHTILKLSENTIHSRMNGIHPVGSK